MRPYEPNFRRSLWILAILAIPLTALTACAPADDDGGPFSGGVGHRAHL